MERGAEDKAEREVERRAGREADVEKAPPARLGDHDKRADDDGGLASEVEQQDDQPRLQMQF